jgi:hypothetical protein
MTLVPEDPSEVVPHVIATGNDKRRRAKRLYGQAVILTGLDDQDAEAKIREAIAVAASALYWLEGTEFEEQAHAELHTYGAYAREQFPDGCHLEWTGGSYESKCPVKIAHKRFGFSIGFVGNRLCSICREDASECSHILGALYEVQGGQDAAGRCNVCARLDCREHVTEGPHRTRAHVLITEGTLREVSFVSRPKQPDARLTAVPFDTAALREALGPGFRPGVHVSCSACLMECPGFDELPSARPEDDES